MTDTTPTATEWLEARLHIYGPHSDENTRDAAEAIAHLVRYLNHATRPHRADTSVQYPATIDVVAGNLHATLAGLPQLLGQLAARADAFAADPRLHADGLSPATPALLAASVATDLRSAALALQHGALDELEYARQGASRLALQEDTP